LRVSFEAEPIRPRSNLTGGQHLCP
jgi:hypothetical protein